MGALSSGPSNAKEVLEVYFSSFPEELPFSDLKISKLEIMNRINEALKMVELSDDYLDRNPFSLSQSELKKVVLASILIKKH